MKNLGLFLVLFALGNTVQAETLIPVASAVQPNQGIVIDRIFPYLWNQVFGSMRDEVRPGRTYQYTIEVDPKQTLYVNVISPLKQAYIYVPGGGQALAADGSRPITRHWQGNIAGQKTVALQVWSNWQTDFILEVTRK